MCSEQCNANQTAEFTSVHDLIRGKTRLNAIGICRPNPNAKLAWMPDSVIKLAPTRPSSESCKTNPTANLAHDLASIGEPIRADESRGPPACGRDAHPPNSKAQPMAASGLTPPGFRRRKILQSGANSLWNALAASSQFGPLCGHRVRPRAGAGFIAGGSQPLAKNYDPPVAQFLPHSFLFIQPIRALGTLHSRSIRLKNRSDDPAPLRMTEGLRRCHIRVRLTQQRPGGKAR